MKGAKLKVFLTLYMIVVLVACFVVGIFQSVITVNIGIVLLIVFLAALPLTAGLLKIMLNREMSKPGAKIHKEFMDELWKNGYTQRFFDLGKQAINQHMYETPIDLAYLMDLVLYQCDYFNINGMYKESSFLIGLLDFKEVAAKSTRFIDGGMYVVMYYSVLMETSRGLGDRATAQRIIDEGKPFLDRKYSQDALSMAADSTVYNYYMLFGNYEMADKCVQKLMSYRSVQADKFFTKYFYAAELSMVSGNKEMARQILDGARQKIGYDLPVIRQAFDMYYRRLGL